MDDIITICGDCADRLPSLNPQQAPELLEGLCPQCGGSRGRSIQLTPSFVEFPEVAHAAEAGEDRRAA